MNVNNHHIIFAPLPAGCTHILRGPTDILAINTLGHAPYRWDPTRPTNGYNGSWTPAFPAAPAPAPVYARPMPFRNPHPIPAGFVREDLQPLPWRDLILPRIAPDTNQPPVRAIIPHWGGGDELVPPGHGRFVLHDDGTYRLQGENVQQWEEWEDGEVDWEQVNRWKELAALGRGKRRERDPAGLTSSEERRLRAPKRAWSERSWPESEVTDPELVERAEQRRREREGWGGV